MREVIQHHKNSKIFWRQFGQGPKKVLCLHGYGEDSEKFSFLEQHLGNQFSFYCIDLPYHGKTNWLQVELLTPAELDSIIAAFFNTDAEQTFYLMGYSLGARVALSLYQINPTKYSKLILLAPDGFTVNPWYWIATQTRAGNLFFKYTMEKPRWFFALIKKFNQWKLINDSVFKFAHHYIDDADARSLLYQRWTSLRLFKPNLKIIASLIKKESTKLFLFYGRFDKIIRAGKGNWFCQQIGDKGQLHILPAGHQLLNEKSLDEITKALLQ